jgi:hypothetical protein
MTGLADSVDWLNTSVGSYLATSDFAGSAYPRFARVASFSPITGLSLVAEYSNVGYISAVNWLSWQNKYYLGISQNNTSGDDIIVMEFNTATNTLTTVTSYGYSATVGVSSLNWLLSGAVPFLAYTGSTDATAGVFELGVLRFDGSTVTKVNGVDSAQDLQAVEAHIYNGQWLLCVGRARGSAENIVEVYEFNNPEGSYALSLQATFTHSADMQTRCLSWLDFDGKTYLALGTNLNPTVRILEYDELSSPTLRQVTVLNYGSFVGGVDWLVTGSTIYLAMAGGIDNSEVKIQQFDPYAQTLTELFNYSTAGRDCYDVSWNRVASNSNTIYLGVGTLGAVGFPGARVLGFNINNQSQLNLISDNTISDVTGGSGLLVDTVINGVTGNRAYNCQEGLVEGIQTQYPGAQFDDSNWNVPHA